VFLGVVRCLDYFVADNGVKQGAVLSHVLFCVYIDDLLLMLTKAVATVALTLLAHMHTRMMSCSLHQ